MGRGARWTRAEWGAALGGVGAVLGWAAVPQLLSLLSTDLPRVQHVFFVYLAFAVAFAAAVTLWHLFDGFWMRRIEDRPTSRVRSMAAGAVELNGRAGEACLVSPLGGHACVYWDYSIWRFPSDDEQVTVCFQSSADWPMPLGDGTGTVWIDLRGGEVLPSRSETQELERGHRRDPKLSRFLMMHGVDTAQSVRIQERWIEAADPLFLHGAAHPASASEAARTRVDGLYAAAQDMLEREKADPSVVAETALQCVGRAERRRAFERELEARLADPREGPPRDDAALEQLRDEARGAADRPLIDTRRRFARWFLAAAEGTTHAPALALAAHVASRLPAPDQTLLVGRDPRAGIPLGVTGLSEQEILGRHQRFRTRMMTGGASVAAVGGTFGTLFSGAPFVLLCFGALCFAAPAIVGVGSFVRSRWARDILRSSVPTAKQRFPS